MTHQSSSVASVPRYVSLISPILKGLLAAGVPILQNRLVTIRGRTSGAPRTTPLAIIEVSGRRWVWSPWGEVHWVRNLRAAGKATIDLRDRSEEVMATELDSAQRVVFFRDVFGPFVRSMRFGSQFVRMLDGVDIEDPTEAARGRVVFELRPMA